MTKNIPAFLLFTVIFVLSSCHKKNNSDQSITILSINDVYRTEGMDQGKSGGLARVAALRQKLQTEGQSVLLLHAGDFLQPSFSARVHQGAEMIDVMNYLDSSEDFDNQMIVTFGNHEFDKGKMKHVNLLQDRIDESQFLWLDSNINWVTGTIQSSKFKKWILKEMNGIKVGLYSATTEMVQPQYIANFDDPVEVTKHYVPFLKEQGADLVIALTHQRMSDDTKLLELEERYLPDLIIGGHEHYRQLEEVNGKWIVKADADALSAATVEIKKSANGNIEIFPTIIDLDESIEPSTMALERIESWRQKTHVTYCQKLNEDMNCLDDAYGFTQVDLIAEESEIRRFETNFGNFIADAATKEFGLCEANGTVVNSGSIRLNHNISAQNAIKRLHLEGIFAYPSPLKLIEINGQTLKKMITHSISMWTANGHWLLVSGFRFTHDPENEEYRDLVWADSGNPIKDEDILRLVVPQYLIDANTDHDGYMMISEADIVSCSKNDSSLKDILIQAIKSYPNGIAPVKDGRVCNTLRDSCK